jgi:hypothetical protein
MCRSYMETDGFCLKKKFNVAKNVSYNKQKYIGHVRVGKWQNCAVKYFVSPTLDHAIYGRPHQGQWEVSDLHTFEKHTKL